MIDAFVSSCIDAANLGDCPRFGPWPVLDHSRKRGRNHQPGPPVHDDLVLRDVTAKHPNEKWLGDIAEHPTTEGKLYLC
jgi:transposase InsO family protein